MAAITHPVDAKSVQVLIGTERLFWRYEKAIDNPVQGAYGYDWGVGLFRYIASANGYVMVCAIDDIPLVQLKPPYPPTLEGKRARLVDEMVRNFNLTLDQLGIQPGTPPPTSLYPDPERQATYDHLIAHVALDPATGRFVER